MSRADPAVSEIERTRALVTCVGWVLIAVVLYESLRPVVFVSGLHEFTDRLREGLAAVTVPGLLRHVVMLGVVGAALGLDPRARWRRLLGVCVILEVLQAVVRERHPRSGDLAVNLLVSGLAFSAGRRLLGRRAVEAWLRRRAAALSRLAALGLACLIVIAVVKSEQATSLTNWQPDFALHLGDEGTRDRPWVGAFEGVALYPSALDAVSVRRLAAAPFSRAGLARRRNLGAVALWVVSGAAGDALRDRSGVAPAVDLDRGRAPNDPYFVSRGSVEKLVAAARSGAEFSVEVRARSLDLRQTGPARLVSLSVDPYRRNFTIGQERRALHFRVRSPAAGENGIVGEAVWPEVFTDDALHDLVTTYRGGRMRLFRDGRAVGDPKLQRASWAEVGKSNPTVPLVFLFLPLGLFGCLGWLDVAPLRRLGLISCASVGVTSLGSLVAIAGYDTRFALGLSALALAGSIAGHSLALGLLRHRRARE